MASVQLNLLIIMLIVFDVLIIAALVYLGRHILLRNGKAAKISDQDRDPAVAKTVEMFASLIKEADQIEARLKEEMNEKQNLMKTLNRQLDQRITSLNLLLNRADILIADPQSDSIKETAKTSNRPPALFDAYQKGSTSRQVSRQATDSELNSDSRSNYRSNPRSDSKTNSKNGSKPNAMSDLTPRSNRVAAQSIAGNPPDARSASRQQNKILNLARQGLAAEEIAQRMSMPKGEVQLVLNLKQKTAPS